MTLPVMQRNQGCTLCPLHEYANNRGIPSRPACLSGKQVAVLLLGEKPGLKEDNTGTCHVGPLAPYTLHYADYVGEHADVYIGNAIRCMPAVKEHTFSVKELDACMTHAVTDLEALCDRYERVAVLLTGATAIKQFFKVTLKKFKQGCSMELPSGRSVTCFATFLPAFLDRDPAKGTNVEAHLDLVRYWCEHGRMRETVHVGEIDYTSRIAPNAEIVSLDIETYGAIGAHNQRFFHPTKSMYWDQVARSDLICTVGAVWRVPGTQQPFSRLYRVRRASELDQLVADLRAYRGPILGMNINFDLMYLRAFDDRLRDALQPYSRTVIDLGVINFLENPERIEKSLKALSTLLGTYDYGADRVSLKDGDRYTDEDDPALHRYNLVDCHATLQNYDLLMASMGRLADTDKTGDFCRQWYSDLLWFALRLMERGIRYDRTRLEKLHARWVRKADKIAQWAKEKLGVPVCGEGSGTFRTEFATECANEYGLLGDGRLKKTPKKAISGGKENLLLFLGYAPVGSLRRLQIRALLRHKQVSKLVSSYTEPMLALRPFKKKKTGEYPSKYWEMLDSSLIGDRCYPMWKVVPASTRDDGSQEGGTKQVRITGTRPAIQTAPPALEDCQLPDLAGWHIVRADSAQVELRVAASLSNDQAFVDVFRSGTNAHKHTASIIFGRDINPDVDKAEYHMGKTLNFLVLFYGGYKKLIETGRRIGLEIGEGMARNFVANFDHAHKPLRAKQHALIEEACRTGRVELPLLGVSRNFGDPGPQIERIYATKIVNFPVQASAAAFILNAQVEIDKRALREGWRTECFMNTYDEGGYVCPPDELDRVLPILYNTYSDPPLYRLFCEQGWSHVPLDTTIKVDGEKWSSK